MNKRITELDGVRAIAVVLVFLNHFAPTKSFPWLDHVKSVGWVGVDIFFVLSGFLVTSILLTASASRKGYFLNFYARRSLRIFPLYYALLTGCLTILLVAKHGLELRQMLATWGHPFWLYAYLGNVRTAVINVLPPIYFVPMWSLHVEEQFYLVLPLAVLYLTRARLKRVMIAAVVLAPVIRLMLAWSYPDRPLLQFMLFPCRMDSLALGGLLALWKPEPHAIDTRCRRPLLVITVASLAMALLTYGATGWDYVGGVTRTVGYTLFDIACAGAITLVLVLRGTRATAWLNWRPLQYVGMISFGVYLLQYPAEAVFNRAFYLAGVSTAALEDTMLKFLGVAGICLVLSAISWRFWETKWLSIKRRFPVVDQLSLEPPVSRPELRVSSL